jgi:hypothetical protein
MRRHSKYWATLIVLTVLGTAVGTLVYFLEQEPDFYKNEWASPADADDSTTASNVLTKLNDLMNDLQTTRQAEWSSAYSAEELNAFFRERQSGNNALIAGLLGDVPEPRFAIRGDHLLIAFRYGEGKLSTVITLELKVWLVKDQANLLAIQFVGFRAGAVPVPKYLILDRFAEMARKHNADVDWYRHEGQPVALCKLYANQPRPDSQISTLKIADGQLMIGGKHSQPNLPQSLTP